MILLTGGLRLVTNIIHIDTTGPEAGNNWYYSLWGFQGGSKWHMHRDTSGPKAGSK